MYIIKILISRFLQRPQKWSRGNHLILRHSTETKLIDGGGKIQRVRQADSQAAIVVSGFRVETARDLEGVNQNRVC